MKCAMAYIIILPARLKNRQKTTKYENWNITIK